MSLIRRVIEGFNAEDVSYVVVGGIAVLVHGHVRTTLDLDVIISLETENILKALKVIAQQKLIPRLPVNPNDFADANIREHWVKDRNLMVLSFIDPSNVLAGVDIFASIPVDYHRLLANSIVGDLNGIPIRCCSFEDLIELKRISGRPIDLNDIMQLEFLRDERNKEAK